MTEGELGKDQSKQHRETNVGWSSGVKGVKIQGHQGQFENTGSPKESWEDESQRPSRIPTI